MRLAFTPLAEQDLEVIADYIAVDNPARALSFVRELRAQCQRIVLNPPTRRPPASGAGQGHSILRARSLRHLLRIRS